MPSHSDTSETRPNQNKGHAPDNFDGDRPRKIELPITSEPDLFDLYEKVAETRPGTRDAEIFEKIHEWTFSDFSMPPHQFAGITLAELAAWQKRNRINLSAGHIRPQSIDLERGYVWGQIRMAASVNRLHSTIGPPSAEELKLLKAAHPK